jgi:hypothetical protein
MRRSRRAVGHTLAERDNGVASCSDAGARIRHEAAREPLRADLGHVAAPMSSKTPWASAEAPFPCGAGRWLVAVRVLVARGNWGRFRLGDHAARGAQVGRGPGQSLAFARVSPTDDFLSVRWSWFT